MCFKTPDMKTPAVQRIAAPTSDAARREGELERTLRRQRAGVAADVLTTPLGIVGGGLMWGQDFSAGPDQTVLTLYNPTLAAIDVLAERDRQIEKEGWTPEHDDQHIDSEMAAAGACYAIAAVEGDGPGQPAPFNWPWADRWWKPMDARSNLVRAAALILAEIERLDRAKAAKGGGA